MSDYDDVMSANNPTINDRYQVETKYKKKIVILRLPKSNTRMTPKHAREMAEILEASAYAAENGVECKCGEWVVPERKKDAKV